MMPWALQPPRCNEAYEKILRKPAPSILTTCLLRAVQVLKEFSRGTLHVAETIPYIHVDEYQDTNRVQYEPLAPVGWRGAQPLRRRGRGPIHLPLAWRGCREHFSASTRTILRARRASRENYRSTQKILDAAGSRREQQNGRLGKNLISTRSTGGNLVFFEARDSKAEPSTPPTESVASMGDDRRARRLLYRRIRSRAPLRKPCAVAACATDASAAFPSISARKSRTLSPTPAWRFSRTMIIALLAW